MDRWNDVSMSPAARAGHGAIRGAVRFAALVLTAGIIAFMLGAGPAARAQSTMSSTESVRSALEVLSRVVAESGKLIAAHRYDQLPGESNQVEAGLAALDRGLGKGPSPLRSKLEPFVGKARIASSAMSEAVEAHRDSMLPLAHRQLADAVREIIASFPPQLRPATGE